MVNSTGLNGTVNNQFGQAVGPPQPGKNAYGRGTGAEIGLLTPTVQAVDINQIKLAQLAEATAAPPSPLVTKEIPIALPGLLTASTARGQAQATYDPQFCPIGRPLTYGLGYVENLQVLPGAAAASSAPAPPATPSPRPARSPTWCPTVTAPTAWSPSRRP